MAVNVCTNSGAEVDIMEGATDGRDQTQPDGGRGTGNPGDTGDTAGNTANATGTVTNTSLGWQAQMPYYVEFLGCTQSGKTHRYSDTYVHLSSPVAGTIVYGQWGFVTDSSPSE